MYRIRFVMTWCSLSLFFFFFKHKTAYEITRLLEFRRVLFRSRLRSRLGRLRVLFGIGDLSDSGTKRIRRSPPARQPSVMQKRLETTTITVPVPLHDHTPHNPWCGDCGRLAGSPS